LTSGIGLTGAQSAPAPDHTEPGSGSVVRGAASVVNVDTNKGMGGRLLLVHSPLVGRATWDLVAAGLAGRGYPVSVPDLTGTVTEGPPYCSR